MAAPKFSKIIVVSGIISEPKKVSDTIKIMGATLASLRNSGSNLIPITTLDDQDARLAALVVAEENMTKAVSNKTLIRNGCLNECVKDRDENMAEVQKAIKNITNPNVAIALVVLNGYTVQKQRVVPPKPPIVAINKKDEAGTVIIYIKKPDIKGKYGLEWAMSSNNGLSWVQLSGTNKCKKILTGLVSGQKVLFRYRVIVDDFLDWITTSKSLTVA